MIVDDLVKHPGSWLSMRRDTGVVISSRIRLARNIKDVAFPEWAGDDECVEMCNRLCRIFKGMSCLSQPLVLDMQKLDPVDKEVLKERHLISNEFTEKGAGSALVVSEDERIAIMINEEDHLRLQAISPGMDVPAAWETIDAIDSELEKHVDYAFSPALGYLTACPSNVGTGLRASVMMHLCGLKLRNELEPVIKALDKMGYTTRGLHGEGTEAYGGMFQISNQITLGSNEKEIVNGLVRIVGEVASHENNARERLMESEPIRVLDDIGRAYGILMNARVLMSKEAIDHLSSLRLGVELNIVRNLTVARINEIMLLTQPGHLQKQAGRLLEPQERDEARARIIRQKLKNVSI